MADTASGTPAPEPNLLTPDNAVLLLVDHQPQMFFRVGSGDREDIINATVALAKAAKTFRLPTVLTTVAAGTFSGPLLPEVADLFSGQAVIDRTTMNPWEDQRVVDAIRSADRQKIICAGLWTEVCVALPALCARADGYEFFVVADACGGVSPEAHQLAIQRMAMAGVAPTTWLQVLLELQRDWARTDTYDQVMEIVKAHAGAYGQGVIYAKQFAAAQAG